MGTVRSNTTVVHSLAVTLKNWKTMDPVAFLTLEVFSSLLPLKAVVVPEMSTMKALGILLFHVSMSLRTATLSLKRDVILSDSVLTKTTKCFC